MFEKSIGIVCTTTGFGGLELNTLKLAQWLKEKDWQVRLLVNESSKMYSEAGKYCEDTTTVQQVNNKSIHATAGVIKQWLKKQPVTILFTPFNKDIAALSWYKRFTDKHIKLVYQQQMKVGVAKRDFVHTFRYRMLDLWISPLPYLRQETISLTRVPEDKIIVIPLAIDARPFVDNNLSVFAARNTLHIPDDALVIGVLGRIDPKKGQDFLIRAIAYLRDKFGVEYHLLIMGSITPHEGDDFLYKLYNLVDENDLKNQVHFREYSDHVSSFYAAIDVFAMPSAGETFGMVTVEAMAAGVPVIGTNRDGTKGILQDGKYGWLYEPDSLKDFCEKLVELQSSENLAAKLLEARNEVIENYSKEYLINTMDEALTKLAHS